MGQGQLKNKNGGNLGDQVILNYMQVEQLTNRQGLRKKINRQTVYQTKDETIEQSPPYVNCANGDKYYTTSSNQATSKNGNNKSASRDKSTSKIRGSRVSESSQERK